MIIWINGTFGVGKSVTANVAHNILWKNKSLIYDPDEDWKLFFENQHIFCGGGTLPQNNITFIKQLRQKIYNLAFNERDKILIIPMAITEKTCKDELLDYLKNKNLQIKHIVLTAKKNTIKDRIKKDITDRDKNIANNFLEPNIKFIESTFPNVNKIDTEEKSIEIVAKEIISLL